MPELETKLKKLGFTIHKCYVNGVYARKAYNDDGNTLVAFLDSDNQTKITLYGATLNCTVTNNKTFEEMQNILDCVKYDFERLKEYMEE